MDAITLQKSLWDGCVITHISVHFLHIIITINMFHVTHVATDGSYLITGIITQFHQSDTTTSDKLLDDFDQRTQEMMKKKCRYYKTFVFRIEK